MRAASTSSTLRERELLGAARGGDEDAFRSLVEPHHAALHAHCYRMLGSLHDAEDALQDTLLRAWRGLPGVRGRSSLRAWLYRIATNACIDASARRPKLLCRDCARPALGRARVDREASVKIGAGQLLGDRRHVYGLACV
ncbi:MAG TPA: sigma-70 family RNA polymerase sigma factor, partial [Solirubrobacterales bacterium]|nr:sigma-70 family RNA polymerase sigma factor [Solirubrobacterales bacterium]